MTRESNFDVRSSEKAFFSAAGSKRAAWDCPDEKVQHGTENGFSRQMSLSFYDFSGARLPDEKEKHAHQSV